MTATTLPISSATPLVIPTSTLFALPTEESVVLPTISPDTLPISSATPLVIPTSTLSALPTEESVVLPTIPPDTVQAFVSELTNDIQNCLLPCFWSIIPGETEWKNVEAFLSTFAYDISYGSADGTFSDVPVEDSFIAWMSLFLPELSNAPFSYAFDVQNGVVTMVDASILPVPNSTLPTILNEYGQPTEIWLLTANAPMDDVLGFYLTLFYAQHHFMLGYGGDGEVVDGKVHGCLSGEEESFHLVAWSPEEELTFADTTEGLHKPLRPVIYDLLLEEATGMSVETFYETFRNANEPVCLETPIELWPNP
jgi:hypothetical protein